MGMQLPGELVSVLSVLGFTWPQGDEEKLFELGNAWTRFSGTLTGHTGTATTHAQNVWQVNVSDTTSAFEEAWKSAKGPVNSLEDAAKTCELIGVGLMVCAGIVLALKISVITQLILLAIQIAQAIATAVVTFGASLAEIPIFRILTKIILDQLLNLAMSKVMA
jgi:hypothetical protein